MTTLRTIAWIILFSCSAFCTEIQTYSIRLQANQDGSGTAVGTLSMTGCTPGTLIIPCGFTGMEEVRLVESVPGAKLELEERTKSTQMRLTLPTGVPSQVDVTFSFSLKNVFQVIQLKVGEKSPFPKSDRIFKHGFTNSQDLAIGVYRLEFVFPEGFVAQAIREQLPKPTKGEVSPRVTLSKLDGRQAAVLQLKGLQQGDDTSMTVELAPARRSLLWLVAGLVLAVLYLIGFRDLVSGKPI